MLTYDLGYVSWYRHDSNIIGLGLFDLRLSGFWAAVSAEAEVG